ncbi:hypothetical protein [Flavobacterium silvisoli]|uniref:hypothetical protein n=1 Tax=Flavobacterium silvisoli TaxID=2529433 RepID=UPI0012B65ED9|nr:hypothetical protein [Flavobacterium silvisoli]
MIPCNDSFYISNVQIGGTIGRAKLFGRISGYDDFTAKVMLKTTDSLVQNATNTDANSE